MLSCLFGLSTYSKDLKTVPGTQRTKPRLQPAKLRIEIARQAKSDPQMRGLADAVVQRTGVDADDVPEVPEPLGLFYVSLSFDFFPK